jgi:hypothetical protein
LDCDSADAYFGEKPTYLTGYDRPARHRARLPEAPAALARLKARVAEYLAEVRALRDQLWDEVDCPRRDEVARLARFDGTADSDSLHRHEARLDAQLHRAFREADRLRRAAEPHSAPTDQPSRPVEPDPSGITLELEAAHDITTRPDEVRSPSVHSAFAPGSPAVAEASSNEPPRSPSLPTSLDEVRSESVHGAFTPSSPAVAETSANAPQRPSSSPSGPPQAARPEIATSRETKTFVPKLASIKERPLSVHELMTRPHLWRWGGRVEWRPGTATEGWPVVKGAKVSPLANPRATARPGHRAEDEHRDASKPRMTPEPRPAHLEDRNHDRINTNTPQE